MSRVSRNQYLWSTSVWNWFPILVSFSSEPWAITVALNLSLLSLFSFHFPLFLHYLIKQIFFWIFGFFCQHKKTQPCLYRVSRSEFRPPEPHEIIMISTINNGYPTATVSSSGQFVPSAGPVQPVQQVANSDPFFPASSSSSSGELQSQLNSFTRDEDLIKNNFNNLPRNADF